LSGFERIAAKAGPAARENLRPATNKKNRRLTEEQIEDMAEQCWSGRTVQELATSFSIAGQTVGIILRRYRVDTSCHQVHESQLPKI
jgi:DNA invertase Pin-like site-specific DNA recombinase